MAPRFEVVTQLSPLAIGPVDFTFTGFGTAQAIQTQYGGANSTNNPASHSSIGFGYADGTNQTACGISAENAVATTNTDRRAVNNLCVQIMGPAGTLVEATFDSFITDGVRLQFSKVDTVAHQITVVLINGCDAVKVFAEALPTTGVNDITTIGHKPSFLFANSVGHTSITSGSVIAVLSYGFAHNSSLDVVTQRQIMYQNNNNVASSGITSRACNDSFVGQQSTGVTPTWLGAATAFNASGFSVDTGADAPGGDYIIGLSLKFADPDIVKITTEASPTATGDWTVSGLGITPQIVFLALTACATVNSSEQDDDAGVFGSAVFTDSNVAFYGISGDDADAANTSEQSQYSATNVVDLKKWNGSSHAAFAQGAYSSINSGNYVLNFPTYVDATPRQWFSVAIAGAPAVAQNLQLELKVPCFSLRLDTGIVGSGGTERITKTITLLRDVRESKTTTAVLIRDVRENKTLSSILLRDVRENKTTAAVLIRDVRENKTKTSTVLRDVRQRKETSSTALRDVRQTKTKNTRIKRDIRKRKNKILTVIRYVTGEPHITNIVVTQSQPSIEVS